MSCQLSSGSVNVLSTVQWECQCLAHCAARVLMSCPLCSGSVNVLQAMQQECHCLANCAVGVLNVLPTVEQEC